MSAEIFGARILQFVNHIQVLMASSSNDTVEVCSACAALIEPTNPPSIGISLEKALDTIRNVLNIPEGTEEASKAMDDLFQQLGGIVKPFPIVPLAFIPQDPGAYVFPNHFTACAAFGFYGNRYFGGAVRY